MIEVPRLLREQTNIGNPNFKFTLPKPYCEWQKTLMQTDVKFALFVCGTKSGKAVKLTEDIPTPFGWRKMGDIEVGDYVFSEHGKPIAVTAISDVMHNRDCYRVVFSDGNFVEVDGDHLWVTETAAERKNWGRGLWLDRKATAKTTLEIRDSLFIKLGEKCRANHFIPCVSGPLKYPKKTLPIDPYLFGVWLGDGWSKSGALSINKLDTDIIKEIVRRGYSVRVVPSSRDLTTWRVDGFTKTIRELGFLDKKIIPEQYLINSAANRLAFLQGLMDTDGTCDKLGGCNFYSSQKHIADCVEELAVSFGIRCTRSEKTGTLNGVKHKQCYIVNFKTTLSVFFTERKRKRLPKTAKKISDRSIVAVEKVKSEPVKCITVANESHLFLVGKGCIPTHNSLAGTCKIIQASATASKSSAGLFRVIAPTYALTNITFRYLMRLMPNTFPHRAGQTYLDYKKATDAWNKIKPEIVPGAKRMTWPHNGAVIECVHAQDPEVTIEGEATQLNIMDEMSKMKEQALSSVYSTTTQTGGLIRGYTTPRGKNWVYHKYLECLNEMELARFHGRKPTMIAMTATTIDNPYVPRESIEIAKKMLPLRIYNQLFLAQFVDDGSTFVGFRELVRGDEIIIDTDVQIWKCKDFSDRDVVLGGDWARTHDFTVVTAWCLKTKEMCGFLRFQGANYKTMIKHVYEFGMVFKEVHVLKHDKTGIGDVIDELLQALPWPIDGLKFNNENKSAMVSQLMVDFQHGKMTLPNWPEMLIELDAYEVEVTSIGNMKYGAPSGMHDDIVTSMMLGWTALMENNPNNWDVQFLDSLKVEGVEGYYDFLADEDD